MSPSTSTPQDAFKRAPQPTVPYRSERDGRWAFSGEAMRQIIDWNCHGCSEPSAASVTEFGAGGSCEILALVSLGDGKPIPELLDNGRKISCTRRHVDPPPPPQTETLFSGEA